MLLALLLAFAWALPLHAAENADISSAYAYAVDLHTMQVLYEKQAQEKLYPASMTKVLTALVAIDAIDDLEEEVTIDLEMLAGLEDGTYTLAGFLNGEVVTMGDLLYGVLLPSGADACQALAVSLFGSEEAMVEAMNAKAKALGMKDSHFTNTVGMHDERHYTSAYDLALLMRAAWENDVLREVMSTTAYTSNSSYYHGEGLTFHNSWAQQLQYADLENRYIIGGKTGYTPQAGYCFFGVCEIAETPVIVITANSQQEYYEGSSMADVETICSQIEKEKKPVTLAQAGDSIETLDLRHTFHEPLVLQAPCTISAWIAKAETTQPALYARIKKNQAPIKQGEVLAAIEVRLEDTRLGEVDVISAETIESEMGAIILDTVKDIVWPYGVLVLLAAASGYGIYTLGRKWCTRVSV